MGIKVKEFTYKDLKKITKGEKNPTFNMEIDFNFNLEPTVSVDIFSDDIISFDVKLRDLLEDNFANDGVEFAEIDIVANLFLKWYFKLQKFNEGEWDERFPVELKEEIKREALKKCSVEELWGELENILIEEDLLERPKKKRKK